MGYAIAEELANQGAEVVLVSGPVSVTAKNSRITVLEVGSAQEMYEQCVSQFPACNGAVMCAAVADFTPVDKAEEKTKRGRENWYIELKPTKDIAAELGKLKKKQPAFGGLCSRNQ